MIRFGGLRISLDRREPESNRDFISHAHSDHVGAARSSTGVMTSDQTADLIRCAYGVDLVRVPVPDNAKLLDAGHMLGSKQLCINDEASGKKVIYTGDFHLMHSRTAPDIEITDADSVILDSTFCSPSFTFNDRYEAERALGKWVAGQLEQGIVVLSAYRMGKAQELISILNDYGITPVVSRGISQVNKVYSRNGVSLDYVSAYDSKSAHEEKLSGTFVGITERRDLPRLRRCLSEVHGRRVYTAYATGFAQVMSMNSDAQFVISDHSDFRQSMEYIDATGASDVYTYGANSEQFAANLKASGYNARPLPPDVAFG